MIDILVDDEVVEPLPAQASIQQAVTTACLEAGFSQTPSLCIRFAGDAEVQTLNRDWRQKDSVTDVLSFPMQEAEAIDPDESLGDIILATPFTTREAARLSLPVTDHMLHLIIHATLHLLGYDHIDLHDAEIMQNHERAAMEKLGLHNPYPDEEEDNDV